MMIGMFRVRARDCRHKRTDADAQPETPDDAAGPSVTAAGSPVRPIRHVPDARRRRPTDPSKKARVLFHPPADRRVRPTPRPRTKKGLGAGGPDRSSSKAERGELHALVRLRVGKTFFTRSENNAKTGTRSDPVVHPSRMPPASGNVPPLCWAMIVLAGQEAKSMRPAASLRRFDLSDTSPVEERLFDQKKISSTPPDRAPGGSASTWKNRSPCGTVDTGTHPDAGRA